MQQPCRCLGEIFQSGAGYEQKKCGRREEQVLESGEWVCVLRRAGQFPNAPSQEKILPAGRDFSIHQQRSVK